jgi:hypothetical protein
MIRRLFIFAVITMVLPLSAWAGRVKMDFSKKSNGITRFALVGSDLCDSDSFRVLVYDENVGSLKYYQSGSGRTSWDIGSSCGFNQEFSHNLLKPGVTLKVEAYSQGYLSESFWANVPCYETIEVIDFNVVDFTLTEITSGITCGGGVHDKVTGRDVVVAGQSAPGRENSRVNFCSIKSQFDDRSVTLRSSCSEAELANIIVIDKASNKILCDRDTVLGVSGYATDICQIKRDPRTTMKLKVKVNSGTINQDFTEVIYKDPTYLYAPQVQLQTSPNLLVRKNEKALGRGYYWTTEVVARVFDQDLDSDQSAIKVLLIEDTINGEVIISQRQAASGEVVRFNIEHQFIEPLLFGEPKHEGALTVGQKNRLKIRVLDAYGKSGIYQDSKTVEAYLAP